MRNKTILLIVVFIAIAGLSYGQERYTIRGEFPDHSLDNKYIILYERSAILGESKRLKQAFIDSILVVNKEFHYEGTINRNPFLAYLSCSKDDYFRYETSFIVEPGDILIRVAEWKSEGSVSGTPINDDYNTYVIEREIKLRIERNIEQENKSNEISYATKRNKELIDAYKYAEEGWSIFMEKYAQYPDVVRSRLALCIDPNTNQEERNISRYLHIVNLMPEVERNILLSWRDYRIKMKEHMKKLKALKDSMDFNKPRFTETIPDYLLSSGKNE